jgi:glycosyltransferase involved in cell wall biosynthesis
MKKITFFINNLGLGGAERVFVDDVNELHHQGFDVSIVLLYGDATKSPLIKELKLPSDRIYFLQAKNLFDYSVYKAFYNLLIRTGTNVLYATLHDATFVSRLVAVCIPALRLVTREANTTEFKSFLHKCADVCMNWRVDVMIAVSEEVKKSMLSYQSWYKKKLRVLYNGVRVPEGVVVGTNDAVILAVGSLTPKKNYQMLLEAFLLVLNDFPDISLRIVGTGVLKEKLQEYIQKNKIEDRVVFLGNLEHHLVEEEYKRAAIFALSSDQEGCPNVLLEAMSFGVPSVATAVGAVPEIIEDGISGFTTPRRENVLFATQIKKLLSSKDLRQNIGFAGKERVVNVFSNTVHIKRLKDILLI